MLTIKPHHFADILRDVGAGASSWPPHPYGHAFHTIAESLLADPGTAVRIELGADDICLPCHHNVNGVCDDTIDTSYRPQAPPSKQEWNLLLDKRWCGRLGLQQSDEMTARELCERIRDRAGDIREIYREEPQERTMERQKNLRQGIKLFLDLAPQGGSRSL